MLILDEYWDQHPELSEIPIYCELFGFVEYHFVFRCKCVGQKVYVRLSELRNWHESINPEAN